MIPSFNRGWLPENSSARISMAAMVLLFVQANLPRCHAQSDSFRDLNSDRDALQARVDLIQHAQVSIDVAYYAVDTGDVPIAILELLRQAAMRGVRVRFLGDGLRSRLPADLQQYLQSCGVQIKSYHPTHKRLLLNRRLHSKLILVDSDLVIVGSRNLRDEHFGMGAEKNYVDCEAIVAGDVAKQTQAYFDWLWRTPDVESKCHPARPGLKLIKQHRCPAECQQWLNRSLQRMVCRANLDLDSHRDWMSDAVGGITVDLLRDCTTSKKDRRLQCGIIKMMDQARCSILIESPYPAFDRDMRRAISRARRRGVRVTMLTNSLKSSDQLSVYAAYQNQKRGLLREGVVLREYCGQRTLHAKTMIVDDYRWMLGSYNFDARSDNLNLELMIYSDDPVAAQRLSCAVHGRIARSARIASGKLLLGVGHDATPWKRTRMIFKRVVVEAYRGWL